MEEGHHIIRTQIKKASHYCGLINNLVMECRHGLALDWIRQKTMHCREKPFAKVEDAKEAIQTIIGHLGFANKQKTDS